MSLVMACIDGAAGTESVVDYASWSALRLGAPLEFLHVLDRKQEKAPMRDLSGSLGLGAQESLLNQLSALDEQRSRLAQEHGRQLLEGARQRAAAAGASEPAVRQRHGTLADTVLDIEGEVRLFVLGHHEDEHAGRRYVDHNVERVVRSVKRPVLISPGHFRPVKRFALAFDASTTGRRMVEAVARSPLLHGMPCDLVTVGDGTQAVLDQISWARGTLATAGFDVHEALVPGEPEVVLGAYGRGDGVDLLVMGAYGHSRMRYLVVGSTTTELLRTSTVPVLILR
jgi:nucleotide-binding universal stress UspA family protein